MLEVSDTGQGLPSREHRPTVGGTHGNGFGLTQVRERLATLYGNAASMALSDHTPCGTRATLRLPLPPRP